MSYSKQQKEVRKPPLEQCASRNQTGFKKSTDSARGSRVLGSSEHLVSLKSLLSTASCVSKHRGLVDKESNSLTANELSSTKLKRIVKTPLAPQKLKLLLFPLDERIRFGLEKDGHNSHLELSLSAKKRISSVLLHLNNKWGNSSVALGDLMLFPFNIVPENLGSCRRWTMDDKGVNAGDVHAAIGSPTIFRLRYSWFPVQSNNLEVPDAITPSLICQEDSSAALGSPTDDIWAQLIDEELHGNLSDIMELISDTDQCNFEEHKADDSISHLSVLFASSESDISFEALLSEVEEFNSPVAGSPDCNSAFHPTQLVSDSLDAFINDLQSQSESGTSFIADSENTCDLFAAEVPSVSGQELLGACSENLYQERASQDAGTNSENLLYEVEQESKTNAVTFHHEMFNSKGSLVVSSINWNDSMGPWDIELPTEQNIKGDSFNLSELVW